MKLIEKESKCKDTMEVPADKLGYIIGKKGVMLDNIRAETQTDVDVPPRPNNPDENHRIIHLTARTKDEINLAKKKIQDLMREKDEHDKEFQNNEKKIVHQKRESSRSSLVK